MKKLCLYIVIFLAVAMLYCCRDGGMSQLKRNPNSALTIQENNYKEKKAQFRIFALIAIIIAIAFEAKERQSILEKLLKQKDNDYKNLIAEKERGEKEYEQTIANFVNAGKNSITADNIEDFENSKITEVFHRKKEFRQGVTAPSKSEWRALEMQFSKNMPTVYDTLAKDKKLSTLEFHICMLLILGFEDSSIANLTNSIPQTITTAKSRANKKIFNAKGAKTLKAGLLQLIKANDLI